MTLVMAYVVLVTAALAAVAALADQVARWRRMAGRWIWLVAMLLVVPVTVFVMVMPNPGVPLWEMVPVPADPATAQAGPVATVGFDAASLVRLADTALIGAWLIGSAVLLLVIGVGQWRLSRERRRASPQDVHGHRVLLTDDLGPAVAGVVRPVVLVPRWVVALDESSQRVLLAHEVEHARERDTRLLMSAAVLTALLPWNPVVWWLASRLRVAVELDCDQRVLARNPGVRRYVDLLLLSAERPRLAGRFLAAHFGERASDLERRIEGMTESALKWRRALLTGVLATLLIGVACESPRPDPVAPGLVAKPGRGTSSSGTASAATYFEFQVEKPVAQVPGGGMPRYPDVLRQAGVEGEVLVAFVVDENGTADTSTFKVLRSTHELFTGAVKNALPTMRFAPAEVGGRKVKQLVQQPFSFAIVRETAGPSSKALPGDGRPRTVISGVPSKKLAFTVERSPDAASVPTAVEPKQEAGAPKALAFTVERDQAGVTVPLGASNAITPSVLILSNRGEELFAARGMTRTPLADLLPESIASVEVLKGNGCPAWLPCPLITVRLKAGYGLPSATGRTPK